MPYFFIKIKTFYPFKSPNPQAFKKEYITCIFQKKSKVNHSKCTYRHTHQLRNRKTFEEYGAWKRIHIVHFNAIGFVCRLILIVVRLVSLLVQSPTTTAWWSISVIWLVTATTSLTFVRDAWRRSLSPLYCRVMFDDNRWHCLERVKTLM